MDNPQASIDNDLEHFLKQINATASTFLNAYEASAKLPQGHQGLSNQTYLNL